MRSPRFMLFWLIGLLSVFSMRSRAQNGPLDPNNILVSVGVTQNLVYEYTPLGQLVQVIPFYFNGRP
jgi:hypothetical protein